MNILAYGETYTIPMRWVKRWKLLTDWPNKSEKLYWTATSSSKFRSWYKLNTAMDSNEKRRVEYQLNRDLLPVNEIYSDLLPYSSILSTVSIMIPVNGEHLLSVSIDTVSSSDKKKAYELLGQWIRENQLMFRYRYEDRGETHRNLGIGRDPTLHLKRGPPLFRLAMLLPYDVLVGIIHSSYQGLSSTLEDSLSEAPWWRINWKGLRDFYYTNRTEEECDNTIRKIEDSLVINSMSRVEDSYVRNVNRLIEEIDRQQGSAVHLSNITRIFMGLPVTTPDVTTEEEGTFSFAPNESPIPFQHTEELSLLLSHPLYFKLLARQALVVPTDQLDRTARKLYGLNSFLTITAVKTANVIASEAVAAWIKDSVVSYYDAAGDMPRDYEYIVSVLYQSTSREFILGISTILQRLRDETKIPLWHREETGLLLTAINALLSRIE